MREIEPKNDIKREGEALPRSQTAVATVKCIDFLPRYLGPMVELGEERFGEKYTSKSKLQSYIEKRQHMQARS